MASPYNASESESADEIIETGFDPLLFWDQNRQIILIVAGLLLLAGIGAGWYEISTTQRTAAAESALASAGKPDEYQKVIDQYPGTVAAGNASLLLAGSLRADKKLDQATQVLQDFLAKYPTHPMAHAGMLSLAETLEAQGKMDEALAEYQAVTTKYPDSFSAPLASLAQANLLKTQGKTEEARRVYENFVAQFPDSVLANEAMAEMHLLGAPSKDAAASAPAAGHVSGTASALSSPVALPSSAPLPSAQP